MRILLINPKPRIWVTPDYIPLGIAYIAACLEEAGHDVRVLDMHAWPDAKPDFNVDIVGISANTPLVEEAWRIAKRSKEESDAVTVMGGYHPTFMTEEVLSKPYVDIVVRFEGELTMVELADRLEKGGDLGDVKGISYKRDGKIVHNPDRPPVKDLDSLPFPAYHLFKGFPDRYSAIHPLLEPRRRSATIITSRGCSWGCLFCSKYWRAWRPRTPENVVEEWRWLIERWGIERIGIMDDCWSLGIKRAKEIMRLIIEEGLAIPWDGVGGMRVDTIDRELAQLMRKSGCYRVAFGVEHGNQKALDMLGKGITLEQVERAFKLTKEAGIETIGFFVLGMPYETREMMMDTIRFAVKLDPDYAQFTIVEALPGSPLFEQVRKHGRFLTSSWSDFGFYEGKMLFEVEGSAASPRDVEEMFR
ncbi:TPA: radical SAM protein, partial [Candidatus Bathyarchaeota archaeon]|nr:radical SAM protein [Candidatus Bathyarchaeota archaeon]